MPNVPRAMRTERSPIRFATPYLEVETRSVPASVRSRETRQDAAVGSVAIPRAHIGGDTDALDWRSEPHLLAILARGSKREREAREEDRFRRDELGQHGELAPPGKVRFALAGELRTDLSPFERRVGTRNATTCQ
jgi:hypothetical protein